MQDIILLKQGEIVLKGLNKKYFEQKLISNVKRRLRSLGEFDVTCTQSTIYVEPKSDDIDMDETQQAMTKVFGIAAVVRAAACDKTPEAMAQKAIEYMAEAMREAGSFKVETRRADKAFPMTSIEVSQYVGGELAEAFPETAVDVHSPELTVHVEVRVRDGHVSPIEFNPLRFAGLGGTDVSWLAYGFRTYAAFLDGEAPAWDDVFRGKEGKVYSMSLLTPPAGAPAGARFDYDAFEKRFSHVL